MKKFTFLVAALCATMMASAATVTFGSEDLSVKAMSKSGITVTPAQEDGPNAPVINTNEGINTLRVYAKGSLTFDAGSAKISSITLKLNSATNAKRLTTMTASVGKVNVVGNPDWTATWTNEGVSNVKFTVGDIATLGSENTKAGQIHIMEIIVVTEGEGGSEGGGSEGGEEGGDAIVLDVNYAEATYYAESSEAGAENFSIDFMYYNAEEDSVHAPYVSFDIYSASATAISGSYSVANATIGTKYSYVVLTDAELVAEADGFDITDATLTLAYVEQEETEDGDIVYLYDAAANFTANGKKYAIKAQVPLMASKALDTNEDGYYDSWVAYELIEEATAIRTVEIDNTVYARDGRIYAEEGARIYSLTGLDVTRMNGNLEGIYIVKNGNKVAKVAVAK